MSWYVVADITTHTPSRSRSSLRATMMASASGRLLIKSAKLCVFICSKRCVSGGTWCCCSTHTYTEPYTKMQHTLPSMSKNCFLYLANPINLAQRLISTPAQSSTRPCDDVGFEGDHAISSWAPNQPRHPHAADLLLCAGYMHTHAFAA